MSLICTSLTEDARQCPDEDQQWTRIDRGKCSVNMLEPLAYWGSEGKIDTNYQLLFQEF